MNLNLQIVGERRWAVTGVVVGSSSSVSPAAQRVGATAAASGNVRSRVGAARKQIYIYM